MESKLGLVVSGRPLSVYINRLMWACMLPLVIMVTCVVAAHVYKGQLEVARDANNLSKSISLAVDQHLMARIGGLQVLAASSKVDSAHRYRELFDNSLAFQKSFDSHVVLADLSGNMLFNTRVDYGVPLPRLPRPAGKSAVAQALETGRPAIGDIFPGPVARKNLVAIAVPIVRSGVPAYVLLSTLETQQFETYLESVKLPSHWRVTLRDSSNQVISSQVNADDIASQPDNGSHRFVSLSHASPWSVEIEIPNAAYYASAIETAVLFAIAVLLITATSVFGGKWASRRISESMVSLVDNSAVPAVLPRISEVSMVRRLLDQASLARNLAQATLEKSNERFQRFFQDGPMPLCIVSKDGALLDVNTQYAEVFGCLPCDVPTLQKWWELTCPDPVYRMWAINSWNASLVNLNQQELDVDAAQYRLVCKSDTRIFTMYGTALGDDTLVTFFDITRQRLSEERFRLTIEATRDGLWDLNLLTGELFLTPRYYEMSGYFPGEAEANLAFLKQTIHPDDWHHATQTNKAHMRGETSVSEFDYRLVTRTGEVKWMECRARVVEWSAAGQPARMVGVITDIGKRKRVEDALKESEAFARSVLDSVTAHIAVLDRSGFILAVNAPWNHFAIANSNETGHPAPRTGVGINYLDICGSDLGGGEGATSARFGIQAVLTGNASEFSMEYPCHSPELMRWFLLHATPMEGDTHGAVVVHTDITSRKLAEIERKRADALASRLTIFADAAVNYALVMMDAGGHVVEWSSGAESLLQINRNLALGRGFGSMFTAECNASGQPDRLLRRARASGNVSLEEHIVRADLTQFVGAGNLYWLPDGAENAAYALVLSDITAAQQANLRIAESEARLAAVITEARAAIVSTDVHGNVQMFNPAAEKLFNVSSSDMIGATLDRFIPLASGVQHQKSMLEFAFSGVSRRAMGSGTVKALSSDGQVLELEASISKAEINGKLVLTAILRDVTERAKTDRMLAQYQLQLERLSAQLLEQEKETTQHLAQVLHDELGQTLAALRLIFDSKSSDLPGDTLFASWSSRMGRLIHQANRQARQVLTDLRPPLLDELGLIAALDNEIRQRQLNHDYIEFHMNCESVANDTRWPAEVEYSVFMIAREAINNALLHAAPGSVQLHVSGDMHTLALSVQDDGPGIGKLDETQRLGHLGMIGMRERATAIGAKLSISAVQGAGTRVSLVWIQPA